MGETGRGAFHLGTVVLMVLELSLAGTARADDGGDTAYRLAPGVLGSGAVSVLNLYSDNFYYQPRSQPQVVADGISVRPQVRLDLRRGTLSGHLLSELEYAHFDTGGRDDYLDNKTQGALRWVPATRHRFSVGGEFERGHDPFGTNRTEGNPFASTELDKWLQTQVDADYQYGSPDAPAGAQLRYSYLHKLYTTNQSQTRFLDYDRSTLDYTLSYNHSSRTSWLLNLDGSRYTFPNQTAGAAARDFDEIKALTGIRWLATAKTQGTVQVGYFTRQFKGVTGVDQGLSWLAKINWIPLPQTDFELNAARDSQASYRFDTSVIDNQSFGLIWKQTWRGQLQTALEYQYVRSAFVAFGGGSFTDRYHRLRLGLDYPLLRWISLTAELDYNVRSSQQAIRQYDVLSSTTGVRLTF